MKPGKYLAAVRHIKTLAALVGERAIADTPQERRARTMAVNKLAQAARRLSTNNRSAIQALANARKAGKDAS